MLGAQNIQEFQFSEVVYLNSGSPPLKVVGMKDDGKIEVIWSGAGDKMYRAEFLPVCLSRENRWGLTAEDWSVILEVLEDATHQTPFPERYQQCLDKIRDAGGR